MSNKRTYAYQGFRRADGTTRVVALSADGEALYELDPRLDLRQHSPTGLEWGYSGSGPSQLALALLCDALMKGARPVLVGEEEVMPTQELVDGLAQQVYMIFKADFVSIFPPPGWVMTVADIVAWFGSITAAPPQKPGH